MYESEACSGDEEVVKASAAAETTEIFHAPATQANHRLALRHTSI